jgi:hypothetical protein
MYRGGINPIRELQNQKFYWSSYSEWLSSTRFPFLTSQIPSIRVRKFREYISRHSPLTLLQIRHTNFTHTQNPKPNPKSLNQFYSLPCRIFLWKRIFNLVRPHLFTFLKLCDITKASEFELIGSSSTNFVRISYANVILFFTNVSLKHASPVTIPSSTPRLVLHGQSSGFCDSLTFLNG